MEDISVIKQSLKEHLIKYPNIKDFFANLDSSFLEEQTWSKISLKLADKNGIAVDYWSSQGQCYYQFLIGRISK